jgi:hypothetical protein
MLLRPGSFLEFILAAVVISMQLNSASYADQFKARVERIVEN